MSNENLLSTATFLRNKQDKQDFHVRRPAWIGKINGVFAAAGFSSGT